MVATNEPIEKAMWEPHIVNIFCDICIKEIDNGGEPKSHFTKEAWKSLVETFGRETGRAYDYNKLKNKWDKLKKDYLLWRALLEADTGLGLDSEKRTVDASDDWWKRMIAVRKYYLVDSGYPPRKGYILPYKEERYHLPDFQLGRSPLSP
ncbi:Myb_DNA-bind_3 domain-containing protein [Cephalotus follicularis]|uniref:Myb_DNA-bind_3 domain-containing protein n=1 Tax=Cephalotus follicularis TaxID=3775 RepID=A0A1Q3CMF5_CEPFO|nr:Myb_DNA-bind_3 domain-containing protein [Cephalotus follicularis]